RAAEGRIVTEFPEPFGWADSPERFGGSDAVWEGGQVLRHSHVAPRSARVPNKRQPSSGTLFGHAKCERPRHVLALSPLLFEFAGERRQRVRPVRRDITASRRPRPEITDKFIQPEPRRDGEVRA